MARVRLEAVSKRFGSVTAMDAVTLTLLQVWPAVAVTAGRPN